MKIACEPIRSGWNDIFNALLCATGRRVGVKILTPDREFERPIKEHGFDG